MTALYGVNYTKYRTGPTEANIQARGMVSGDVSYLRDTYTGLGTESAADVIYIGHPLNAGDRILGFFISTADLQGTATLDIGTLYNDDEFKSALDVSGQVVSGDTTIIVDGVDYVIGTSALDNIITLTINTATITGLIKITVLYSRV